MLGLLQAQGQQSCPALCSRLAGQAINPALRRDVKPPRREPCAPGGAANGAGAVSGDRSYVQTHRTAPPWPWLRWDWAGGEWGAEQTGTSIARSAVGTEQREPPGANPNLPKSSPTARVYNQQRQPSRSRNEKIKKIVGGFPKACTLAAADGEARTLPKPRLPNSPGGYRSSNSSLVLRIAGRS